MGSVFANRLKELRKAAGMSQEDVARAADVSLSAITKLEAGSVEPTWATVRAIAKALGVSVARFEDEEGEADGEPDKKPPAEPTPKKKPKGK